jgi:hypothetical protein
MMAEAPMMAAEASSSSEAPMSAVEPPAMAAAAPVAAGASQEDTKTAFVGDPEPGYGYVGVWALDTASCATVDQAGATNFAVITRKTFRDGPKGYFGTFGPLVDGKLSITVRAAQGTRTIVLEQSAADALTVDGKALIRCVQ